MRVVNAVLTQLDRIKKYPNVLILTTSNLTSSIDLAFLDRADIVQYIGEPSKNAIYKIFVGCINELVKGEIIKLSCESDLINLENRQGDNSQKLISLCDVSEGLSGRTLRKLPFLAHALFLKKNEVTLHEFLEGLEKAIQKHSQEKKKIKLHNKDEEKTIINGH